MSPLKAQVGGDQKWSEKKVNTRLIFIRWPETQLQMMMFDSWMCT